VHTEQLPRRSEAEPAAAVGQHPVVPDAVEPAGQDMQQEAAHELCGAECVYQRSWTAFQADRGRDFSVIVDAVSA
jgi:hypothetical protein